MWPKSSLSSARQSDRRLRARLQRALQTPGTRPGRAQVSVIRNAAEEALKQCRAEKQEVIDEDGKKTLEDSPSYSPMRRRRSVRPEATVETDGDNRVPVPRPPVIAEPKEREKQGPVPSPPEVPEPKESEEQVPASA